MKSVREFLARYIGPSALAAASFGLLVTGCASNPSPTPASAAVPPPPAQGYAPPPAPGPAPAAMPAPALSADQMAKLCQDAPDTCHRVQMGQPLTIGDVKAMTKVSVSADAVIAQVRNSHTVYHLTASDIIDLKNSGVSDQVIDFLISTPSSIAGSMPVPEPANPPTAQTPPPPPPEEVPPPAPSPDYVWVGGDWVWNGGWVWVGGHWVYPPFPGAVWFHGGWAHGWGGYHRFHGRWR